MFSGANPGRLAVITRVEWERNISGQNSAPNIGGIHHLHTGRGRFLNHYVDGWNLNFPRFLAQSEAVKWDRVC